MEGKKISRKKGEVKIIGSKSLDYTFLDNDFLNLKYTNISHKNDEDNSNNVAPKDSKINKDIQRINKTDLEIASLAIKEELLADNLDKVIRLFMNSSSSIQY